HWGVWVGRHGHPDQRNHPDRTVEELLGAGVARAQSEHASWTVGNLIAAIQAELDRTPGVTGRRAEDLAGTVLAAQGRFGIADLSPPEPGPLPAGVVPGGRHECVPGASSPPVRHLWPARHRDRSGRA